MKKIFTLSLAIVASMCISFADDTLDPNYQYAEPTEVVNAEEIGSNLQDYSFVCNNVQVSVTKGARYATYFGVNAGESVTFTTTQPMKAIVVNGYVKKGFEASCSSGEIAYVDAEEDAVEAEQVLAVTDIDATTLTISCVKQLRCYSVAVYFVANPDIDIEGGEEEYTYSYEWEPTTPTTLTPIFDTLEVLDMTENLGYACTDLYFTGEEFEMDLVVFASTNEATILAPGTYTIDTTYAANTVQASPGGDDYMDYPSVLLTDFEYDATYGEWYYNTSYYLAAGTLVVQPVDNGVQFTLQATTHFGSTVNATYVHTTEPADQDAVENTVVDALPVKCMRNGHLFIRKNGRTYSIEGLLQ